MILECSEGRYGLNCEGNCTNRHCVSPPLNCDATTGECGPDGCQPGWEGADCRTSIIFFFFFAH